MLENSQSLNVLKSLSEGCVDTVSEALDCKFSKKVTSEVLNLDSFILDFSEELSLDYNLFTMQKLEGTIKGHIFILFSELLIEQAVSSSFKVDDNINHSSRQKLTAIQATKFISNDLFKKLESYKYKVLSKGIEYKEEDISKVFKNIPRSSKFTDSYILKTTIRNHNNKNQIELILYIEE